METAFETLMLADGTLAIGHVNESTVTPSSAVSPSGNRLKNTIHSSPERNLSDFILEDNYLEDSWGLKSSILTGTSSHPEKSTLNTSNLSEAISDQRIVSMTAPRARIYRFCWVSDSELDSISVDGKEDTSNCSKLGESSNLNQTDLSMNNTHLTT
ncbi:unnamed protein product [Onchocerca flexuosa]|uniref:Leptin receptor n=1 Tax=Onchocerca flexuosa TaxID=387005 RepID=A0A183H225_9BILA|nr:unnamed protein product [Onchocerca flexuosa]